MTQSAAQVLGFHHPGVVVDDLQKATRFYCELLGYTVYSESSWDQGNQTFNQIVGLAKSAARLRMLKGENAYLELFEYESPPSEPRRPAEANESGIRHLAFLVNDVAAMLDRCVALGGSKMNDPVSVPGRATAVYCRDPFGNLLEFVQTLGAFPELPIKEEVLLP